MTGRAGPAVPGTTPAGVVTGIAALVTVVATVSAAVSWSRGELGPVVLLGAFAVLIAAGELLRLNLPGDRDAAPIGAAMALALALVPELGDEPLTFGAGAVVAVTAVGVLVGVMPHALTGRAPRADVLARRVLTVAIAAVLFRSVPVAGRPLVEHVTDWEDHRWLAALVMIAVALLAAAVDSVVAAAVRAARQHAPLRPVLVDEVRAAAGISAAISATGVLVALAARPMDLLALPVFAVPLLITQFAFRRYAMVRRTYLQTIRSLSRLTEIGGYTETRHSQRVSALAVAIGRDLGLGESELLDLEYAALLHDIGQLSLTDPIPGGATVMASPAQQQTIAELGAGIVASTGVPEAVAVAVARQHRPYRTPSDRLSGDAEVPLASRIIRVANAYDDLVGESGGEAARTVALERIHLGLAHDYDPRVVAALSRFLARS